MVDAVFIYIPRCRYYTFILYWTRLYSRDSYSLSISCLAYGHPSAVSNSDIAAVSITTHNACQRHHSVSFHSVKTESFVVDAIWNGSSVVDCC
jgi:hypothetical protein